MFTTWPLEKSQNHFQIHRYLKVAFLKRYTFAKGAQCHIMSQICLKLCKNLSIFMGLISYGSFQCLFLLCNSIFFYFHFRRIRRKMCQRLARRWRSRTRFHRSPKFGNFGEFPFPVSNKILFPFPASNKIIFPYLVSIQNDLRFRVDSTDTSKAPWNKLYYGRPRL